MFNPFYYPMFYPWLPNDNDKPPTIYSLLESIVNYGKDDKTKIKDLASVGRTTFFDFNYPLSSKINKQDFETMILNHFLMRRIGYDTLTAFKIQLNVKLNEIMPMYNKMIDNTSNTDNSSNTTTKDTNNETRDNTNSSNNNTTNELENNSSSNSNNINDKRYSDTPQNQLSNVRDGNYVTEYNYDTNTINNSDNSKSNGTSTSKTTGSSNDTINSTKDGTSKTTSNTNTTSNTTDNNISNETIKRTPADKIRIYKEFLENKQNIYTMIFNDLECLFYQLI